MKVVTVGMALLCAGGVGAQQVAPPAQPVTTTAAISGVVRDAVTGTPLAGVVVEMRAPSTGAPLARLVRHVTDARGRFVFRDLAAGEGYTVQGSKPGYANGAYGQSVMFGPSGRINLKDGDHFASAHLTLWTPGAISGRVIDEANEPVVGVYVRALSRVVIAGAPQLLAGPAVKTDDRGDYRIAGLAPGQYVIYVPSPSASVAADAPPGTLGAAAPPARINMFSMPGPSRTDAVLDAVDGHHVVVGNYVTPPPAADGRPRTYGLTFHPSVATVDASPSLPVGIGQERSGVDVALRPVRAVNVFGRAVGSPEALKGLLLRLVPVGMEGLSNGAEAASSFVQADGSFAFLNVAAGEYLIDAPSTTLEFTLATAGASESLPAPPGLRWASMSSNTLSAGPPGSNMVRQTGSRSDGWWTRTPISIGDASMRNVAVELLPAITLHGRIEYEGTTKTTVEQTPIMGAGGGPTQTSTTVTTPRPGTMPTIVAEPAYGLATLGLPRAERPPADEPQDRPVITGMRAGEYVIRLGGGADRYIVRSITVDGVDYTRKPIDATTLKPDSRFVLTLTDKLIRLRGSVSDERGPATDGVVLAFPVERTEWRGYGLTPTRLKASSLAGISTFDMNGLPAGDYFVVAMASTDLHAWQDPAFLEKASVVATRVTLEWGQERLLDLRLVRVR